MDATTAIAFIEANPRSTAKEAGLTTAEANALIGQGKLVQAGYRKTGKKGRPPMELVVPSYDLSNDPATQVAVEAAKQRVADHRRFERMSSRIVRMADQYGCGSEQHTDAVLMRREAFLVLPPLPSKNDYVLAGVIDPDLERDLNVPELEEEAA